MNLRLLAFRSYVPLAVLLLTGAASCGKTANSGEAGGGGQGGNVGLPESSSGAAEGGAGPLPRYAGVVLALATERDGALTYAARANFNLGLPHPLGGCPECCCRSTRRGLPPPYVPPSAGEISLVPSAGSSALTTLTPDWVEEEDGSGHGTFHGMSELGWAWFAPLSAYARVPSEPWMAGDTLQVVAKGNEVDPFDGILRAGPALVGVTPPFGSTPLVVERGQPFEVSWAPEGGGEATVLLGVPIPDGMCFCDAPDAAGRLVVDGALLAPAQGEMALSRLSVSTVTRGNATVDLVGAVVRTGAIEVR